MEQNDNIENTESPEQKNKSSKSIFTPIIIAVSIVIGVFIGNKIIPTGEPNSIFINKQSKVSSILKLIEQNYVEKISIDSIEELAIPVILKNLDPHTSYLPSKINEEAHESLSGNFEGIGVQFNIQNDTILIINTISGGPSEKVGILAGDRIVKIKDSLFAGIGITNKDVIKNLKGKKGTKVKLGIKRRGIKKLIYFDVIRDKIPLYSIDVSYMLSNENGYIKISRFAGTTYGEFMEAVAKLKTQGMKNLVLDLRDNGGGYLNAAVNIIDEFLPAGKMIVFTKGQYRKKQEYISTNNSLLKDIKLVVLINSWSASASEIVSGAIQDNDRGTIVGRRSFGKGLVQEEFEFNDNSGVRITTARYYTPTGRCIQKSYKGGYDEYFSDIYHRAEDGEFEYADSTSFPDSLKYYTSKGKLVYGGGGIMPDVFVPIDTSYYTDFYKEISARGLVYKFALTFADNHRTELNKFKTSDEISDFLEKQNILKLFVDFANSKGVKTTKKDYTLSRYVIKTRLKAYVARNIIDNKGYFPIIREIDDDLHKAEEILNKK